VAEVRRRRRRKKKKRTTKTMSTRALVGCTASSNPAADSLGGSSRRRYRCGIVVSQNPLRTEPSPAMAMVTAMEQTATGASFSRTTAQTITTTKSQLINQSRNKTGSTTTDHLSLFCSVQSTKENVIFGRPFDLSSGDLRVAGRLNFVGGQDGQKAVPRNGLNDCPLRFVADF
jgi:hypothetical protein